MKIELENSLGTVYTSTQDVETTIRHNPEKLCKNCKHWERNEKPKTYSFYDGTVYDTKFGKCASGKIFCDSELILGDGLFYQQTEYGSDVPLTGENFGCIHFEVKE